MIKFKKPVYIYMMMDVMVLLIGFYVVLDWFPLSTSTPFRKYSIPSMLYMTTWLSVSALLQRYAPLKRQRYRTAIVKLLATSALVFVLYMGLLHFFFKPYSGFVLLTITLGATVVSYMYWSLLFAYKTAVEYNDYLYQAPMKRENATVIPLPDMDEATYHALCYKIRKHSGGSVLKFLEKNVALRSGNTRVYASVDLENIEMELKYEYSSVVLLTPLNNVRALNRTFCSLNEKLPDDGILICCFESKSTRKKHFLNRYPWGINYLLYSVDFIQHRLMPKLMLFSPIYSFFMQRRKRILSKTEVLGRLYCTGYTVLREKKIGYNTWLVVQRKKQPETVQKRVYGALIRLRRLGKDGKYFEVYKMRTMHPYSEYLQAYIYERNSLQEGGKFRHDIRVTTLGGFMRKYWLDELPMLINLLKGEMKIVGVRPLSAHYFSLYSKELQEKRIRFKPGLLPPFYADMPKTLDEIQESEMRYLTLCEKQGTFYTDIYYFFRIVYTILIKKARSA